MNHDVSQNIDALMRPLAGVEGPLDILDVGCESIHAETDEGLGTRSDRQEYGGAARKPPGLRVRGRARLGAAGSECVL